MIFAATIVFHSNKYGHHQQLQQEKTAATKIMTTKPHLSCLPVGELKLETNSSLLSMAE